MYTRQVLQRDHRSPSRFRGNIEIAHQNQGVRWAVGPVALEDRLELLQKASARGPRGYITIDQVQITAVTSEGHELCIAGQESCLLRQCPAQKGGDENGVSTKGAPEGLMPNGGCRGCTA